MRKIFSSYIQVNTVCCVLKWKGKRRFPLTKAHQCFRIRNSRFAQDHSHDSIWSLLCKHAKTRVQLIFSPNHLILRWWACCTLFVLPEPVQQCLVPERMFTGHCNTQCHRLSRSRTDAFIRTSDISPLTNFWTVFKNVTNKCNASSINLYICYYKPLFIIHTLL